MSKGLLWQRNNKCMIIALPKSKAFKYLNADLMRSKTKEKRVAAAGDTADKYPTSAAPTETNQCKRMAFLNLR